VAVYFIGKAIKLVNFKI